METDTAGAFNQWQQPRSLDFWHPLALQECVMFPALDSLIKEKKKKKVITSSFHRNYANY